MSDPIEDPTPPGSPRARIAWGFATAAGLFGLAFAIPPDREIGRVVPYLLAVTFLPLAAIILAIIRPTRKFGLGLLLGCGAIWLVMLAICGGALLTS